MYVPCILYFEHCGLWAVNIVYKVYGDKWVAF